MQRQLLLVGSNTLGPTFLGCPRPLGVLWLFVSCMWARCGSMMARMLLLASCTEPTSTQRNASGGSACCHTIIGSAPDVLSSCCHHKQTFHDMSSVSLAGKVSIGKCLHVYRVPVDLQQQQSPLLVCLSPATDETSHHRNHKQCTAAAKRIPHRLAVWQPVQRPMSPAALRSRRTSYRACRQTSDPLPLQRRCQEAGGKRSERTDQGQLTRMLHVDCLLVAARLLANTCCIIRDNDQAQMALFRKE